MAEYRKKPVVIEAHNVSDSDWPDWIVEAVRSGGVSVEGGGVMLIKTLEGEMRAEPTDWIIKGVKGELYPCKPDIFEATYDALAT